MAVICFAGYLNMENYQIKNLPPSVDLETKAITRKLVEAHRHLAELKGASEIIPNEAILINTLSLQEAKDSSAIENIVTTHDELYRAQFGDVSAVPAAKEVARYAVALQYGFKVVKNTPFITTRLILELQEILEENSAGFRKLPGTVLRNQATGDIIYTPPQNNADIIELMSSLDQFINDTDLCSLDPLIKMALIHFQFESIHPFYDGNGRTGRIINVLYLLTNDLLRIPVLYLSRYIIKNKSEYYRLLQTIRNENSWEEWVLFMLDAVSSTSKATLKLVLSIKELMMKTKHRLRDEFPRIYSQDLLNNLFSHPYTRISFLQQEIQVSRLTASRYLDKLVDANYLEKRRLGRVNYYVNKPLVMLLSNIDELG